MNKPVKGTKSFDKLEGAVQSITTILNRLPKLVLEITEITILVKFKTNNWQINRAKLTKIILNLIKSKDFSLLTDQKMRI